MNCYQFLLLTYNYSLWKYFLNNFLIIANYNDSMYTNDIINRMITDNCSQVHQVGYANRYLNINPVFLGKIK